MDLLEAETTGQKTAAFAKDRGAAPKPAGPVTAATELAATESAATESPAAQSAAAKLAATESPAAESAAAESATARSSAAVSAPAETADIFMPDQPCLDMAKLEAKFKGVVVRQLLEMFAGTALDEVSRIELSLTSQDYEAVSSRSHAFRGACGTVCAINLMQFCKALEVAARQQDRDECEELFVDLTTALRSTLEAIAVHLDRD